MFDTIAAISTPRGEGGIGIVRMSGPDSLEILEKIFKPISKKKVKALKNFTINYGHLYSNKELVDEVMVSIMKGPKTYTKEDIVEINCHGGYLMTEKVLELVFYLYDIFLHIRYLYINYPGYILLTFLKLYD